MLSYYFELALRSLRLNIALSLVMIIAIGLGIGTSMTMLTTLRAMSGSPIPDKDSKLFVPQIDAWGPEARKGQGQTDDLLPDQLSYRDAMAFMRSPTGTHRTTMYAVSMDVSPPHDKPFSAPGRAVSVDFFTMFDVPFRGGEAWRSADDDQSANVVVLSSRLADRVFPNVNAVGRVISLNARDYRVVGVLKPWNPQPRFYDLTGSAFEDAEAFYLPFSTAISRHLESEGNNNCSQPPPPGWEEHLGSECVWLQFWVELPTASAVREYRTFLENYVSEQQHSGRFAWPARVELHDVREWLVVKKVVPEDIKVNTLIGMGFLVVCLINAIGLMLARFARRGGELSLRRALGASRVDIFVQCLVETAVVGLLGGVLGLLLTAAGLAANRTLLASQADLISLDSLTRLDTGMVIITIAVAVASTVVAGLYPTWHASHVPMTWHLRGR